MILSERIEGAFLIRNKDNLYYIYIIILINFLINCV